jgi:hypothetical protein
MQTFTNPAKQNGFEVCRVLQDCALIKVASFGHLRAAKKYMRLIAAQAPSSYLVFSKRTRRVLARLAK